LAVGEEAAADGGAILGGFPVTVEEVEVVGFVWLRNLWRHSQDFCFFFFFFFNHFLFLVIYTLGS